MNESMRSTAVHERGSVACVIVTFNRKQLLFQCIEAISRQTYHVDRLVIVDNASTDGTWESLQAANIPLVDLMRMDKNLGGAGGFHHGMKRAFESGCDWIWIMDDDAAPDELCLESLLSSRCSENPDNILCPVICGSDGNVQHYHHKIISTSDLSESPFAIEDLVPDAELPIQANAFVGPLFNRVILEKFGLPKAEYFIWCDDLEYTYRAGKAGQHVRLIANARINHFDVTIAEHLAPAWKIYYLYRNKLDFIASNLNGRRKFNAIGRFMYEGAIQALRWLKAGRKIHAFVVFKGIFDFWTGKRGKVYDGKSFRQ